jgi:gluconate kinase
MAVIILDGLPGVGKSFIADNIFHNIFGYHFYDADIDLPEEEIQSIKKGLIPTRQMRHDHITRVINTTKKLETMHANIVVAHAFIKNRYRQIFCEQIPQALFVLVECESSVRQRRCYLRQNHIIKKIFVFALDKDYESPKVPHAVVNNDFDGTQQLGLHPYD